MRFENGAWRIPRVPSGIPQHLQTHQQRAEMSKLCPTTVWIRTWFGNDNVTRQEADAAYNTLCGQVDCDGAPFIDGNWAFEDDEELADATGAPTTTGITPPYVLPILKRYPDILEGSTGPSERDRQFVADGNTTGKQALLMIVVDKIACETGAVLLIGIDDFGKTLPQRLRIVADDVAINKATWENGQALEENFREGDVGELPAYGCPPITPL